MIFDEESGCVSEDVDNITREISGATMGFVAQEIERKLDTSNPEVAAILGLIQQMKADTIDGLSTTSDPSTGNTFH